MTTTETEPFAVELTAQGGATHTLTRWGLWVEHGRLKLVGSSDCANKDNKPPMKLGGAEFVRLEVSWSQDDRVFVKRSKASQYSIEEYAPDRMATIVEKAVRGVVDAAGGWSAVVVALLRRDAAGRSSVDAQKRADERANGIRQAAIFTEKIALGWYVIRQLTEAEMSLGDGRRRFEKIDHSATPRNGDYPERVGIRFEVLNGKTVVGWIGDNGHCIPGVAQ